MEDYASKFSQAVVRGVSTSCDQTLEKVKAEAARDPISIKLRDIIVNGFPDSKAKLDIEMQQFWTVRHQMSVVDDLIILGAGRVFIPVTLRKEFLHELHAAHPGRDRMLQRARQCVFWPGITNDVTNAVRGCQECEINKASQQREPLHQDQVPTRPGEAIAADFFTHDGREFLVITDKYSGWPAVCGFGRKGVSTTETTNRLTGWAANMGVPTRLTTDNGPQFKSEEFKRYCQDWGIKHEPSSPYHHESNGYAEAAVKSMKDIIRKIRPGRRFDEDLLKAILEYRNTPRKDGLSPAQRIFGKPMRTRMPYHPMVFKFSIHKEILRADRKAKTLRAEAKTRYDEHTRELPKLQVGDIVRLQHPITKRWDKIGKVVERHWRDRSYAVKSESGRLYWRNRRFIKLCKDGNQEPATKRKQAGKNSTPARRRSPRVSTAPKRYGQ